MSIRKFIYILLFCAPLCAFAQESPKFEVTRKFIRVSIPDASREYTYNYGKFPTSGIKVRIWDQGPWMLTNGANYEIMRLYGVWSDSVYQQEGKDYEKYANYSNKTIGESGNALRSGCYLADDIADDCDSAYLIMVESSAYEVRLQLEYTGTPDWEFSHWQVRRINTCWGCKSDTIDTVFNLQTFEEYMPDYGWCKYENVAKFYIGGNKCTQYDVLSTAKQTILIPIFKKVTAVERVEMPSYSIADGRVNCEEEFRIYDLVGRDVTQLNGSLRGIYILKAGKATTKIIVP